METNLKARLIGALVTVLALALILPNILHRDKGPGFTTEIPAKPKTPDWVDESQSSRVRIELDQLASGDMQNRITPPQPRIADQDDPKMPHLPGERASLDEMGAPVAWTLQVGAFNTSSNAIKFRDQLRAKDFKAYMLRNSATQLDHIFVGPMLQRAKAEQVREQLTKEMAIKGIRLQQYKPE